MNTKWYIPLFLFILAVVGLSWEPTTVHNQEIVVQFDGEVSVNDTEDAVALVKTQLQSIGVSDIEIIVSLHGDVKVTYYSDVAIAHVQALLSEQENLPFGVTTAFDGQGPIEFPASEKHQIYKFDVSEIRTASGASSDFNGCAVDLKTESDRFFNPYKILTLPDVQTNERQALDEVAYLNYRWTLLQIKKNTRIIPEVRAGPVT